LLFFVDLNKKIGQKWVHLPIFGSCEIIETEIKQKGTSKYGDRNCTKNNYELGKVLEKETKIFSPKNKYL